MYSELNRARNSQGTNPRTGGCLHKFWDFGRCSCRNFGTCIITLMLSSGLVRRDGLFWDFGSLYQGQVPHVAMGRSQFLCIMTGTPLFWDFGSFGTRRCGVLNASCCGTLCRAKIVLQLSLVLVSVVSAECVPSAPCSAGGDHRKPSGLRWPSLFPQLAISTSAF